MRRDIQSLRGVAVLLVVAYHARLGVFGRGFLGVDVFFVISGFLITGLITRELDSGTFSFTRFYWRRAKRLLPAAYAVLVPTALAAVFLLGRLELRDFLTEALGAVSFCANFVLWKHTSYFGGIGEYKPLLHMWSLSLEEQFYLLFPFALWITPARHRRVLIVASLLVSFGLCLALLSSKGSAVFYLLPTRAWELLLGAAGAVWFREAPGGRLAKLAGNTALVAVLALSMWALYLPHPRWDAALVCIATLVVIWAHPSVLAQGPVAGALSVAGDMSYSLYLVHWPIFSFADNVFLGEIPLPVRLAAVVVSLVLARFLFLHVEQPIHRSSVQPSALRILGLATVSATIVLIPGITLSVFKPSRDWIQTRRGNQGLSSACDYGSTFTLAPPCQTAEHPRLMVWGDSLAMQWVPGLVATGGDLGIVQATRSSCGPVLDLAAGFNGPLWARDCMAFNRSVLDFIQRSPDLRYVVLSARFAKYLPYPGNMVITDSGPSPASPDLATRALVRTIGLVRAAGKKVVVLAPPPSTGVDSSLCVERLERSLPTYGAFARAGCSLGRAEYLESSGQVTRLLEQVARDAQVKVVWPAEFLCAGDRCRTAEDGVPLYRDSEHLSYDGSVLLSKENRLMERLVEAAR